MDQTKQYIYSLQQDALVRKKKIFMISSKLTRYGKPTPALTTFSYFRVRSESGWNITIFEALHVTYCPVDMADYSNPFKKKVFSAFHHSLSLIITNSLSSNGSMTVFCWIDFTRPWLRYWTLVQIFCLESIDEIVQGLFRELEYKTCAIYLVNFIEVNDHNVVLQHHLIYSRT